MVKKKRGKHPNRKQPSRYLYSPGVAFSQVRFGYTKDQSQVITSMLAHNPHEGLEKVNQIIRRFGGFLKAGKPERVLRKTAAEEMASLIAVSSELRARFDNLHLANKQYFYRAWRRLGRLDTESITDFLDDICDAASVTPDFYPNIAGKKDPAFHWLVGELAKVWIAHNKKHPKIHSIEKPVPTQTKMQQHDAGPFVDFLGAVIPPFIQMARLDLDQFKDCYKNFEKLPSLASIAKAVIKERLRPMAKKPISPTPKTP